MFGQEKRTIAICLLYFISSILCFISITAAPDIVSDIKIIDRYKQMLNRKPQEGSTFDRLYQYYLEGAGLDALVTDYQAAAAAKPNDPNVHLILGHIYKRLGQDASAVAAYQRAVELAPTDYYPHFALGRFYGTLRQHETAIDELAKAVTLSEQTNTVSPNDRIAIYKALGRAYFSRDRVDEAIAAWTKIAELDPQNIFARRELADLFYEQELYPQAIAQHEAIIALKKDDPYRVCLSLREIGKIHEDIGAYQKARERYDAALALTAPGNWLRKDLQHRIISIYAADANWQELIAYYQGKLSTTPNDPELLGLLASAYIENQQTAEGIDTYRKGLELAPTDVSLRLNLITVLRNSEKLAEAVAEYEVLREQHPDDFGIYREIGQLYLQLGDEDKARATYQEMIARNPENANTHLILAEIYTGHDWIADAVAAYQQALSLAPDNLDYIEYFGEFYFRRADRAEALATWNRMVADEKADAANYDRLARLLETKTFLPESLDASRKAVALAPDGFRYRKALARRLMESEDYDAALVEYTEAIKLAPNAFFAEQMDDQRIELYRRQGTLAAKIETLEAELEKPALASDERFAHLKQLAKMYLKLRNTTYALKTLLEAKALQPDNVTVNRWCADIHKKEGRHDEAIAVYMHLTQIDNTNAREYYSNIANAYLKGLNFEKATSAAKQVIAHSPRNPEGYQLLAHIAKHAGDYAAAIQSFKQALRLRPDTIASRAELAATYSLAGNIQQAIAQYWRCWELSDSVSEKLSFIKPLTEAYYDLGRRDELAEKLKQLAQADTASIAPILALAAVYRNAGNLSNARFQLAKALDREKDSPTLLAELVEISLAQGEIQEALNYQHQLVKVNPEPVHQRKLGELLFHAGREQEAVQAWSKMLHTKNRTFDAKIRLAKLLIQHGLLEEALFALDSAVENISGTDTHIRLYQIGVILVDINEPEKARPYFQRLIEMSKPAADATSSSTVPNTLVPKIAHAFYGPPGINLNKLDLANSLSYQIQQNFGSGGQAWVPNSFEEARVGALVQLKTILDNLGELPAFIQQFEKKAAENPKDVATLELLAQLYTLMENPEKTAEIVERLIAASPNNLVYQGIRLRQVAMQAQFNCDSFKNYLDKMTGLTANGRNWYISEYAAHFYQQGHRTDAEKLLAELEGVDVNTLTNRSKLLDILAKLGRADHAEKIISQLPAAAVKQFAHHYSESYQTIANTFLREGHPEKAIAFFWQFIEATNPSGSQARRVASLTYPTYYSSSYRTFQTNFPAPTTYFSQTRLAFLKKFFNMIWISEQQELFYTTLWGKYEAAEGKARIYPALAISYCKWWEEERARALEILHSLQQEFPEDLTLKLNAIFVSIQAGKYETAIELLKAIATADPRNLSQYYDLTLQIALHTGNTALVREVIKNLLNSPIGVKQLFDFSKKLRSAGLIQFAVAVSKKTTNLAMTSRDPNFLRQLSQKLKDWGQWQDAERLIERASRLETLHALARQAVPPGNMSSTIPPAGQLKRILEQEAKLVHIARKNPTSKSLQNLAALYKSRNQIAKATETYKAALALRPNDGDLRNNYADMLNQSGQVKKAVEQYAILFRENPKRLQGSYYYYDNMIKIFIQAGGINQLVSLVKDTIDTKTPYGFAGRVARHFIEIKNPKPAIEIYEKMLELGLDSVLDNLVSAYIATGEREKAIELLRKRLKTGSVEVQVEVIRKLSEFNETLDDLKNLTAAYEAKLAEGAADPSTLYLLAVLKILTDDIETADSLVDKLLEDIPTDVRFQWLDMLAYMYRGKSEPDRELRLLEASIEKVNLHDAWSLSDTYQRLATVYSDKGEREKARNAARKMGTLRLMARHESSYWEKESIARTYMEHEMWDEAEVLLTEVANNLSADYRHRESAREQIMKIRVNRDGSAATVDAENPMAGMNIGSLRSKAQEHVNRKRTTEAIEIYKQILEAMPEDLESQAQLAALYTAQNQHDIALEIWNMLIQHDPMNTKYQDGLVEAYRAAGKIVEAIKLAQDYIKDNPNVWLHYTRLAQLYVANRQVDEAITAYQKSIELAPGERAVYEELAQLYLEKDDLDAAEKSFKAALQYAGQGGKGKEIELQLLQLYQRQGKFEAVLKRAKEQGTLTFDMQMQRASIHKNKGETEKAISAYRKALEMAASLYERQDVNRELMNIYASLGKLEEFLKEVEEQGMLTSDMLRHIADIHYRNTGEFEKAAKAYQRALELTTESHWRRQIENQMMELYRRSGKMEEFLIEAEKAGTITYDMQMELARHYSVKRQPKKAAAAFEKARNMTTDRSDREDASKFLMVEYARLGNSELAIKLYEELTQTNANASNNLYSSYYSGLEGFKVHFPGDDLRDVLIETYQSRRQLNQLQAIFEAALEKNSKSTHILEMVAEIYRRSNNHEKAAEVYQKLGKIAPGNVHYFYYAAASLNKIGKTELATEFLNRGAQALPESPWKDKTLLRCALGSICFQTKMYTPAIALFKDAIATIEGSELSRNNNEWRLQRLYELLGQCSLRTEQYEEAVTAYQRMADISTSSDDKERAAKIIKQAYKDGNLHEKRIPEQRKKVEANPDDLDARLALAQSCELSDKIDEAIAQYRKISELQPDVVKWYKTIGGLYEKSNQTDRAERLAKAAAAYEKAIALEPNSFELYDLLAKTHKNRDNLSEAVAIYQRALDASLTPEEQDLAVKAILELYDKETEAAKRIAVLQELSTKVEGSVLLPKLLGDAYIESGDSEKAEQAYTKWIEIRQREKGHQHGSEYYQLAEQLLNRNVMPALALQLAKLATNSRANSTYLSTLGHAYLANEQYEDALEQFQRSLNLMNRSGRRSGNTVAQLLKRVSEAGKHVKDKNRYVEMIGTLIETMPAPEKLSDKVNAHLTLAEFCRELGMTDKAKAYVQKAGFFPETLWLTLGPFDNTKGVGYKTAYIPEETGQIDTSAKYDGVDGQVNWKQGADKIFDGFFSFGEEEKPFVAYASISFTAPEEREAHIRFDSDDQGKVWLNGEKVYAHRRTRGAQIDRRAIPVKLIAGKNTLLVKVCNETLPWGFYLRITDPDGNPLSDLKVAGTRRVP